MINNMMYVYIAESRENPGIIKIGKTQNIENRAKEIQGYKKDLFGKSLNFHIVYYIYYDENVIGDIEKLLKDTLKGRIESTECFEINKEHVIKLLELIMNKISFLIDENEKIYDKNVNKSIQIKKTSDIDSLISIKKYAEQRGIRYESARKQITRLQKEDPEFAEHVFHNGNTRYLDLVAIKRLDLRRSRNSNHQHQVKELQTQIETCLQKIEEIQDNISNINKHNTAKDHRKTKEIPNINMDQSKIDLVTIKEYAERSGLSVQAVGQRINRYRNKGEKAVIDHIYKDGRIYLLDPIAVDFLEKTKYKNITVNSSDSIKSMKLQIKNITEDRDKQKKEKEFYMKQLINLKE